MAWLPNLRKTRTASAHARVCLEPSAYARVQQLRFVLALARLVGSVERAHPTHLLVKGLVRSAHTATVAMLFQTPVLQVALARLLGYLLRLALRFVPRRCFALLEPSLRIRALPAAGATGLASHQARIVVCASLDIGAPLRRFFRR